MTSKIKQPRRLSVPHFSNFTLHECKTKASSKFKKKVNKTRTILLLLMNDEYLKILKSDNIPKINHKSFQESDKEYNMERYIYLKPEIISPTNLFLRGEGQSNGKNCLNLLAGFGEDPMIETNQPTPFFERKSLAFKKLSRFNHMINPNEIKEDVEISIVSNSLIENNYNTNDLFETEKSKVTKGFFFLRNLAKHLKLKKPRKISHCLSPEKRCDCLTARINFFSPNKKILL